MLIGLNIIFYFGTMTIIQLEYIIAVDKFRHFGKAAESCHVTQPTLSMQIQKMEDQLGVIIFDRSKNPVEPTDAGGRIISQARIVVHELRKIDEMVHSERTILSGDVTVGIIPTLSPYLIPIFINSFLNAYPEVNLHIEEMITEDILRKLRNETIDIGLLVSPLDDPAYTVRPIFYEDFIAYVSGESLFSKNGTLNASDIAASDLLLLNEGHCFRNQVLRICGDHQSSESRFSYESGSLEAIKRLVDKHGGMTLLPALAALDMDDDSKLKLRYFADPVPTREVSLVTHKSFLRTGLARALYTAIQESVSGYLNIKKHGEVIKWK
jgi:LysR family hydrogen peroxide-inducible transcriptional activator